MVPDSAAELRGQFGRLRDGWHCSWPFPVGKRGMRSGSAHLGGSAHTSPAPSSWPPCSSRWWCPGWRSHRVATPQAPCTPPVRRGRLRHGSERRSCQDPLSEPAMCNELPASFDDAEDSSSRHDMETGLDKNGTCETRCLRILVDNSGIRNRGMWCIWHHPAVFEPRRSTVRNCAGNGANCDTRLGPSVDEELILCVGSVDHRCRLYVQRASRVRSVREHRRVDRKRYSGRSERAC